MDRYWGRPDNSGRERVEKEGVGQGRVHGCAGRGNGSKMAIAPLMMMDM
jgi:hypothetical protein